MFALNLSLNLLRTLADFLDSLLECRGHVAHHARQFPRRCLRSTPFDKRRSRQG